jgi:SPP1 gp7 family putative phage head morphogenesis protein
MPTDLQPWKRLPFDQAIDYLRQQVVIPDDQWQATWQAYQDFAFTIAGITRVEILEDLQAALVKSLAEGTSLEDFRRDFRQIATDRGWLAGEQMSAWRVELIYRQNTQTAYGAGRYEQQTQPEVLAARPYWLYRHGDSRNPRPHHLAIDGEVYPADSPFWQTCYAPNGWGCRCRVLSLSAADMERRGLSVSAPPEETVSLLDKATGKSVRVPAVDGVPIAEGGFTTIPGRASREQLQLSLNKMPPELRALIEAGK